LVISERKGDDSFLKHDSIWNIKTIDGEFGEVVFSKLEDQFLSQIVLPKLFNAIDSIPNEIKNFEEFDSLFKIYNAFYGINFTGFDSKRCITDKSSYVEFRKNHLWDLTPESLWERRKVLFSRIVLCANVENDIKKIGGTYLEQIVNKLKELDKYLVIYWTEGLFNYKDANEKAPLNISPESKKTMEQEKYYNQRLFSMPDGRKLCFDLHIKTGNLRFHFYPENGKVYVGYIGKHLDTYKYN
jgi:hypothetical protein